MRIAKDFLSTLLGEHGPERSRDRNPPFRVDLIVKPGGKFIHPSQALPGLTRNGRQQRGKHFLEFVPSEVGSGGSELAPYLAFEGRAIWPPPESRPSERVLVG